MACIASIKLVAGVLAGGAVGYGLGDLLLGGQKLNLVRSDCCNTCVG